MMKWGGERRRIGRPLRLDSFEHLLRGSLDLLIVAFGLSFLVLGAGLGVAAFFGVLGSDPLLRSGGICLVGISTLILLARPPATVGRWVWNALRGRSGAAGRPTFGGIDASVRDRAIAAALGSFALLQMLDVITTLTGAGVGLREGNRVAAQIMLLLGAGTGFVAVKVAAIIVMALAFARMPRQVALVTGWGCCSFMTYVVLHNAYLILN